MNLSHIRYNLSRQPTLKSHVWQSGANYVQHGSALIMSMVLARLLTPEHFGQFALANAYVHLAFIPFSFGLDQVLVSKGDSEREFPVIMTISYLLLLVRLIVVGVITCWLYQKSTPLMAMLSLICGIPESFAPILNTMKSNIEGCGQFRHNMESMVWGQLSGFLAAVIGAVAGLGVFAFCFSPWLSMFARVLVYKRYTHKTLLPHPVFLMHKQLIGYGVNIWFNNIAQTALQRIDKWFVGSHFGTAELGFYNRAFQWAPMSHLFLSSLVTNPSVAALARMAEPRERHLYMLRILGITVTAGVLNFLLWFFGAQFLVPWLFGYQWLGAIDFFKAAAGLGLCFQLNALPRVYLAAGRRYRMNAVGRMLQFSCLALALLLLSPSAIKLMYIYQLCLIVEATGLSCMAFIRKK